MDFVEILLGNSEKLGDFTGGSFVGAVIWRFLLHRGYESLAPLRCMLRMRQLPCSRMSLPLHLLEKVFAGGNIYADFVDGL